mgnify:CR=1 FL=1
MYKLPLIDWSDWLAEIHATLMFIIRDGQILLIEKKRGLGSGKINGPGGKIEPGETPLEAIIRETQEELCITPHAPLKLGELKFSMSDYADIHCHVYRADSFSGVPTETDEAVPVWTELGEIPYHRMWEDDQYWLPLLIQKQSFLGHFIFKGEKMQWHEVTTDVVW